MRGTFQIWKEWEFGRIVCKHKRGRGGRRKGERGKMCMKILNKK